MEKLSGSTKQRRAWIDKRIKTLEKEIHTLKAERNGLAPITLLPPEVLLYIFTLVRDTSDEIIEALPCLGQVCKIWRSTALNSAALWSVVDCSRGRWTQEVLKRAGRTPLHLTMRNDHFGVPNCSYNAIRMALKKLPQARIISFPMVFTDTPEAYSTDWPEEAPFLETFHWPSLEKHHIPEKFTNGHLPILKRFMVKNTQFDWNIKFLCNLTHLEVKLDFQTSWSSMSYPDVADILGMLSEMNELQQLRLSMHDLIFYNNWLGPRSVVHTALTQAPLPHLRVLHLGLQLTMVMALLRHLPHPQDQLTISCDIGSLEEGKVLVNHVQEFYRLQASRGKRMEVAYIGKALMQYLNLGDPSDNDTNASNISSTLRLSLHLGDVSFSDYLTLVGPPLLQQTKYITTDSSQCLYEASAYLPNCSIACIQAPEHLQFPEFPQPDMFIRADGVPLFPSLEALAFSKLPFRKLPKTSRDPNRITLPKFVACLGVMAAHVPQFIFLDCDKLPIERLAKSRRKIPFHDLGYPDCKSVMKTVKIILDHLGYDS